MQTNSAAGPGAAPNRSPACSLAAFEPSLHFVDVVHALDDDAAGRGGYFVFEGAKAGADVDALFSDRLGQGGERAGPVRVVGDEQGRRGPA